MSTPRVLVCGFMPEEGLEELRAVGCEVDYQPERKAGSLADVIAPYTGVIVHSPHELNAEALAAAANLKVAGRAGVGIDNIDVEAATARGVLVMNLPWGNTVTAAEHSLALILSMARNVPQAHAALRAGVWDRKRFLGVELHEKVLGVVGLGRIGREVARRGQALGMEVVGSDPFLGKAVATDLGLELVSLQQLLQTSDVVSLHLPLTDDTHHLIDASALQAMKPGARLVNCARGGIVDEAALLAALESDHLAGAACDVFEQEPTENIDLVSHPRFIGTPHLGGSTREAREKVGLGIARQLAEYLSAGVIRHAVNHQALPPEEVRIMQPYLELGSSLGSFLSQCFDGIERLRIQYFGELTAYTLRPLTAHILVGFFQPFLGSGVNVVNALAVARERSLVVEESRGHQRRGYSSLVRVEAEAAGARHSVAGTVFDLSQARVVELEGLPVEFHPSGNLVVLANDDRPGVVGMIGTFLADRGINIADMRMGRRDQPREAIAVFTLDEPLERDAVGELEAHEAIRWVRTVGF